MTLYVNESNNVYKNFSNRIGIVSGLVLLGVLIIQSTVFTIGYDEVGLKARLGTLEEIVFPGLHFKFPFGIDHVEKVSASKIIVQEFGYRSKDVEGVSEEQLNAERGMITADLNIVEISMAIHYQIEDPVAYLSSVRDTDQFVHSAFETIVREIVGQSQSGSLYTASGQTIAGSVKQELQEYLDKFNTGVAIMTVEVREISPPENVRPAFDKVNEARQEKERRITEARRAANRKIAEARGHAASIRTNAVAEALHRQTEADRKLAEYTTFHEAYLKNPQVVKTSLYVSTLEEILPQVKSVVVTQREGLSPISLFNLDFEERN